MTDDEPFGEGVVDGAAVVSEGRAGFTVASNEIRARVTSWARARAFSISGSSIVSNVSGIDVAVPLYSVTRNHALVEVMSLERLDLTLTLERAPSLVKRVLARIGMRQTSGDPAFDREVDVSSNDLREARRILSEPVRAELLANQLWWHVRYADGRFEVKLDSGAMCGREVIAGMRLAAVLARATPKTTPYR
jgi:hypothetical protein